jgi:hypothetical protein
VPDPLSADTLLSPGQLDQYGDELERLVPGPPQRPSRMSVIADQARRAGDALREYFMPAQSMRHADTPELRAAYDKALAQAHAAGGGKLPDLPGSPLFSHQQGLALDLASNLGAKGLGALGIGVKGLGALKTLGLIGGGLHPEWISQRLPTAASAFEDPLSSELLINPEAMRATPKTPQAKQTLWDRNVGLTREYPNLSPQEKAAATTDELAENFINHAVDNIKFLHSQVAPDVLPRSKKWYEGANRIAQAASKYFKVPLQTASAVYAALSPRKDWFQNVSAGDRLMYIWRNHQNTALSPQMLQKAIGTPEAPGFYADRETFGAAMGRIAKAKTFANLEDSIDKAMWVRMYDEAHHDPGYPVISPEGQRLGAALRKDKQARVLVWPSREAIAKGIEALESGGDRGVISRLAGFKHKVRNFYNNILDPFSPKGDVTIDTHAVAAALLRPLGLSAREVKHNFGDMAAESDITGVRGLYGLYAEAYRRAAKDLGMSPRELQSVAWEAVRGLFPDDFKSEKNIKYIDALWRSREQGVPIEQVRKQIFDYAKGIDRPDWYGYPADAGVTPEQFYVTLPAGQ